MSLNQPTKRHMQDVNMEKNCRKWKRGDRVIVSVQVIATLNAPTNKNAPTGNWWVNLDGEVHLRSFNEGDFTLAEEAH